MRNDVINNTNYKIAPVISTGFENLPKNYSIESNGFYVTKATLNEMDVKFESLITFINNNVDRVPAVLLYAWNEIAESGNPIVPTLNPNNTINRTMLDKIRQWCKK
jgi:hypothetical protein